MMDAETAEILNETRRNGGRIVCCGTTSCRTVESLVQEDGSFRESSKWTEIFIYPGYKFRAMDALITNFHLPESTLVMLVSAFAGREHILHAYETAVQERYRFFSFGDAMFIADGLTEEGRMFQVIKKEGNARRGVFTCPHGTVQTPVFMNVGTQGARSRAR